MQRTTEIRRRRDGSIDTGHYARIGRRLHGNAMREAAKSIVRLLRSALGNRGRRRPALQQVSHAEPVFGAAE